MNKFRGRFCAPVSTSSSPLLTKILLIERPEPEINSIVPLLVRLPEIASVAPQFASAVPLFNKFPLIAPQPVRVPPELICTVFALTMPGKPSVAVLDTMRKLVVVMVPETCNVPAPASVAPR